MIKVRTFANDMARDIGGAVASEYAFIVTFIALISAVGMIVLGLALSDVFGTLGGTTTDLCKDGPDRQGTPCFVFDLPGKKKGL